ncbi:unnamed protein product [Mytilus coruscus]|uniref:Uncharacterized protein n=1 Tax=Mytilus coruscus TaxID=42192 RepID=A0A6J8BPL1_MYTCO|nr:unnamed protein product [Mytilus coruscus]
MILVAIFILLGINITSGLFDKAFAEESVYKCPSAKQFDIEAQLTCPENNDHFHCVPVLPDFNAVIRICKKPKWFVKGTFPVWSPKYKKITSVPCTSRRYQDYSYKSNNISVFKCSKAKRFCTEKGQTTLFRDHPTENNLCLCMDDYTFLKEPKNGTYCNEDVENCSYQKSETTTKSHFPKKETERASIIRNDEVESTENLEYTLHSTYIILIAVLLCITIVHYRPLARC